MRLRTLTLFALSIACWAMPVSIAAAQDDAPKMPSPEEMAKMMEAARKYTAPGPNHKLLDRFVGKWNLETRFVMGDKKGSPETGAADISWLIDGRWLIFKGDSTLGGRPYQDVTIMGYDNFKQSFVFSHVGNLDTAMVSAEGDMDPGGRALLMYGTLDEYTTGEHDKMVKYVWRFYNDAPDGDIEHPDRIVLEVHDLPIGEKNTQVIEMTYKRAD